MVFLRRRIPLSAYRHMLLAIGLVLLPWSALAEPGFRQGFPLRNHNPFLQIFGLPPFEAATLAADGALEYDLSVDVANHADAGDNAFEEFVVDGETYFLTLSLRRRVSDRLELGLELPLLSHQEGFLDNAIENWHDTFGMSNSKRRGPGDQLLFLYEGAGSERFELGAPASGLGDIRFSAALSIVEATETDGVSIAIRSGIKVPTGDPDELLGSGATDVSIGLYASRKYVFGRHGFGLSGFLGALRLGDGDVLSDIQRSVVPYGGVAATWYATERLGITTQLSAQGAYYDSDLKELAGDSLQLAVGGDYRLRVSGLVLRFAVVEDVSANATTDFALHFSLHTSGAR